MRGRRAWRALAAAMLLGALATPGAAAPPVVTGVDVRATHRAPQEQVRAVIGDLAGKPLSRDAVRAGLERLWGLGLFSAIRVEEIPEAGGVRLSYELTERALIRRIEWQGRSGLDLAEVAAAASLAIGEEAAPARLAQVEREVLARYHEAGYLGARVEIRAEPVPDSGERDVTVVLDAGEPARIGVVRIQGDTGVPVEEIAKALGLREGRPYRESLAREGARAAQDRLREKGYYEAHVRAGKADWHRDTNRADLVVEVAAGAVTRVEFEGGPALPRAALETRLTFATGGSTDPFEQAASARQIEEAYRQRGYHFVSVKAEETRADDLRTIRFVIDEGPRVTVESLTFTGNRTVPGDRLAREVETRPPGLLRRGLFRQDVLDHDVGVVLAYLRAHGYAEAAVGPAEVAFSDDRTRARVTIPVTEGARFTVGAVTIAGARAIRSTEIDAALPLERGGAWQDRLAEDGQRAIERLYGEHGYYGAAVSVTTSRRDSIVDVRYDILEGEPTRIGRVLVRGRLLTREDVVRRTLPFQSGDLLIPSKLLDGQRRLGDLPAFSSVSIEPLRPPPVPFADVDVTLQEKKPWHLDFGLGYSNADGARGFAEIGHDNVFGTGATVSIRQRLSAGGESIEQAERTDVLGRIPYLFGTPWSIDVDIFQEWSAQLGYDLAQYGLWVDGYRTLFPEEIKGLRGDLSYRLESARYSNVDRSLASSDVTPGREIISSVTPALTLDRRDEPLDPTRGGLHQASLEIGSALLGGDVEFVKARLETRWFVGWPPPTVLALAARLGLAAPYHHTAALAIQDRFFAGGATTVRGYRQNRIGPLDTQGNPTGGNATAILNVEWRFPIWRWFGGALFVDSGAVTPEIADLALDAFKTGVGGGLRLKTPVGPIRLDVGYALNPIAGESRTQVYVTVGNPF